MESTSLYEQWENLAAVGLVDVRHSGFLNGSKKSRRGNRSQAALARRCPRYLANRNVSQPTDAHRFSSSALSAASGLREQGNQALVDGLRESRPIS